jgi:aminopeptidase
VDPRVVKLAKVLVHYSLRLKKGDLFRIQGEMATVPLIKAAYAEALGVGAHPYTQIMEPDTDESLLKHGSPEQLQFVSPVARFEMGKIDALLVIWGSRNTRYLAGIDPKRQAMKQKARKPILERLFARVGDGSMRWVGTQFPTPADAQEADLSLADYEDFVYGAGHITSADPVAHWKKVAKEQLRLKRILVSMYAPAIPTCIFESRGAHG